MTTRISFNRPPGQTAQLNSNSQSQPFRPVDNFNYQPGQPYNPTTFENSASTPSGPWYLNSQNNPLPNNPNQDYNGTQRQTVAIEREKMEVKEIPRPQFQKVHYAGIPFTKKIDPDNDPKAKPSCCLPCCWFFAALIGVALITLALLIGLGVLGKAKEDKSESFLPIIAKPAINGNGTAPNSASNSTANGSSSTNPSGQTQVTPNGGASTPSSSGTNSGGAATGGNTNSNTGIKLIPVTTDSIPAIPA